MVYIQFSSIAAEERFVYVFETSKPSATPQENGPLVPVAVPGGIEGRAGNRRRRLVLWVLFTLLFLVICLGILAQIMLDRAEPILRARVVDTLAIRFDSRVELTGFHVSVVRGFQVQGDGLRLYPRRFASDQPWIAINSFQFRLSWLSIFTHPMHVGQVTVDGMAINIPPKEERGDAGAASPQTAAPTTSTAPNQHSGIKIVVDEVLLRNTRLLVGTAKPGKLPLDFEISRIALHTVGPGKPLRFEATLVNPKPVGDIRSNGYFGPFQEASPGDTPLWGSYSFSHANLATFQGIGGILSSTGKYQGALNRIIVDGEANVPDFRLDTGSHPLTLHTVFHAIVDGTTGDTYLQPVHAELAHSKFTVTGSVVKVQGSSTMPHGHHITLDVVMNDARIEDFLRLAVRTDPPVLNGNLRMNARLVLPPGDVPVTDKLHLAGKFEVSRASFSSDKIQAKVNELSRLGQGHPRDPDYHVSFPQPEANALADLKSDFTLVDGRMDFPDLYFSVPGAQVDMNGVYTLDGSKFDFHGQAKLAARPSQMTTGWKSMLLKLADPFFAKQGFGTVVPIEVSGTKSEPHFGLDFGYRPPVQNTVPAPRPK